MPSGFAMGEHGSMSVTAMVYVAGGRRYQLRIQIWPDSWKKTCYPDSDDSDNEGGLGNVERVVMRPPGRCL